MIVDAAPPGAAEEIPEQRLAAEQPDAAYQRFYRAVARAQLDAWLPAAAGTVLDLSEAATGTTAQLLSGGHRVVHTLAGTGLGGTGDGRLQTGAAALYADPRGLEFARDDCLDMVVIEGGSFSRYLAAEATAAELVRILHRGGRLLICADSLVTGLARMAEQGRWAELADTPAADVVLVQGEDGSVGRCFWPEELRDLLTTAGLEVKWIRPRTVLNRAAIERALRADPTVLGELVRTELSLAIKHQGESLGNQLIASARRP